MITHIFIVSFIMLCIIYASGVLYAYLMADRLIFPKVIPSYQSHSKIITLDSSDGEKIAAIYLPVDTPEHLLLYSHGNGEDIGHIQPLLELFREHGIAVFAYDYPGYGLSSGQPSEAGVYAAADAAYQYITETLGYKPQQITLYGRSLGSGPSCWLAERYPVAGLIIDGGFSSTFRVMTKVSLLPWDKFNNLARLSTINAPILLMHGTLDRTVPFTHSLQNFAAIRGKKHNLWVEGAGHNDLIERADDKYWDTVLPFIRREL